MKKMAKVCLIICMGGILTITNASETDSNESKIYVLAKKSGAVTPFLLAEDERAVFGSMENKVLSQSGEGKILFQHPSYTVLSVRNKTVTASGAQKNTVDQTRIGQVFYKEGEKKDSNRYVSTGTILVTFDGKSHIDFAAFAAANHLEYIKVVSRVGRETVLFANHSDKNDVALSSELVKKTDVFAAKPNWILPIKLF